MAEGLGIEQIRRRAMRPRVLIYTGILLCAVALAFLAALWLRTPLKMDVIRDRGSMGREVEDGDDRERLPPADHEHGGVGP
jgi:polyferredoxin